MMSSNRKQILAAGGRKNSLTIGKILKVQDGEGDFFSDQEIGAVWLDGGVGDFLNEDKRAEVAMLVERGEVQLFSDVRSPGCRSLPLSMVDFTFCEKGGRGVLTLELEAWFEACRTIAMYAALAGVGRGISKGAIDAQCLKIQAIEPPGNHKP
jgi:hypothetical protein